MLGDGAEWIKTQAAEHFPEAVKVLDWPHLWRKVRDAVSRSSWANAPPDTLGAKSSMSYSFHCCVEVPPALEEAIGDLETKKIDWAIMSSGKPWVCSG